MTHPFFAAPGPLVFAHRGGAGLAPENTIAAFDTGVALGADGLELDVRLSRDGHVVVHHDRRLERTTNLSGEVSSYAAHELACADASRGFRREGKGPFERGDTGVPTLVSVLERYRDVRIIIELKENSVELGRATVEVVRRADAVERVCLGSFGRAVLRAVRVLDPGLATSAAREEVRWALYRSWVRWPVSRVGYGGYQVPELSGSTRVVSPAFVQAAHAAGLAVQVWTVDAEADATRLLAWHVDALITDRPDLMVPIVSRLRTRSA